MLANIDYYHGAYGKTIHISTFSKEWLLLIKSNIQALQRDIINSFDFCTICNIKTKFNMKLELIKVQRKHRHYNNIIMQQTREAKCFLWEQDEDELETLTGLIDGLINCNSGSGHQYLIKDNQDYIIELSYNE